MDIRFLKGFTPNVGYLFPKHISFSPTPSVDFISIGIGQIIKNHPIYVPIHGLNSTYLTKKITNQEGNNNQEVCQEGGSNQKVKIDSKSKNDDISSYSVNDDKNQATLLNLNKHKRKLSDPIEIGFQHPKIKSKTLKIYENKKNQNSYKFNLID